MEVYEGEKVSNQRGRHLVLPLQPVILPPSRIVPKSGFWLLNKEVMFMRNWLSGKTEEGSLGRRWCYMKGKCRERDKQDIKFSKKGGNMLAPTKFLLCGKV